MMSTAGSVPAFFLVLAVLAVVFQFGLRERMLGRALRRHPERAPLLERLQRQRGWWSLVAPIVMVWFAARAFEHDAPWARCYLAPAVLLIVSMAVRFFRPRSVAERAARPRERR